MPPKLKVVTNNDAPKREKTLLELLRDERRLELKLIAVRAEIGPKKRDFQKKERCFGLSNEQLLIQLSPRKG